MFRFLLRFLLFVLAIGVIALAVGPLLVDPTPAPGASTGKALAEPDSHFIEVPFPGTDGIVLHYLERAALKPTASADADVPAFVLLHGFTFNAFTWNRVLDSFAEWGRVIAYDQTPYGLSDKPLPGTWDGPNPYSKAAALEQLFALMDSLEIEQAVLVGNSSGGTLALEAALADPRRVRALVLLGPWVHSKRPIFPDWFAQLPQVRRLTLLLARYLGGDSPLLDYSYADPTRIDEERRMLTGIHRQMANWDAAWAALLNHSLTDPVEISAHLAEVTQPVLVVTGAQDQVVPVADSETTAAELPSGRFVSLLGCGHVPQEECPQQVADVVEQWLRGEVSSFESLVPSH